jgi:glycosyltransferase involved in cell wall biosynthesis
MEAMLSAKPVITCIDSGGPLEFVVDRETGYVVAPEPAGIARAIETILGGSTRAAAMGRAGRALYAKRVPAWDQVVDTLLA